MLIKAGVDISRLDRSTRRGLQKVAYQYEIHEQELIITSTYEGNHGPGSLHYANQAFDVRPPERRLERILGEIENMLGPDYDVIPEGDHIHIEYDPK